MHLFFYCTFVIFCFFSVTSCHENPKSSHSDLPLKADPFIQSGVLDNGLKYVILRNTTPKKGVSLRFMVHFGAFDERENEKGLAHFIEHMAFNGTRHFPPGELVHFLKELGINFRNDTAATTYPDHTVYKFDLNVNQTETIGKVLDLVRDFADGLTFNEDKIEKEKGVILSEWRTRASNRFNNRIFHQDILAFSEEENFDPIGLKQDIKQADKTRLKQLYQHYYAPDNSVLLIVGDVNPDQIKAQINEKFASWKRQSEKRPRLFSYSKIKGEDFLHYSAEAFKTHSALKAPKIIVSSTERETGLELFLPFLSVLPDTEKGVETKLSEEIGLDILKARLKARIKKEFKGKAVFVENRPQTDKLSSDRRYTHFFITAPSHFISELIPLVEQEIRRAYQKGFSDKEINQTQEQFLTSLQTGQTSLSTLSLAEDLLYSERFKQVKVSKETLIELIKKKLKSIHKNSVQQAFKRFWNTPLVINVNHNTPEKYQNAETLSQIYHRSQKTRLSSESLPKSPDKTFAYTSFGKPGKVLSLSSSQADQITKITLDNNIRLNIYTIAELKEKGFLTISIDGGRYQCKGNPLPLSYSEGLPLMGTQRHSIYEINDLFPDRKSHFSVKGEDDAFVIIDTFYLDEFKQELNLLTSFISDPGWRTEWIDTLKNYFPSYFEQVFMDKEKLFYAYFPALLFGNHSCTRALELSELQALDIKALKDFYRPIFSKSALEVSIITSQDEQKTLRPILKTLGSLPKRNKAFKAYQKKQSFSFPKANSEPFTLYHYGKGNDGLAGIFWPMDLSLVTQEMTEKKLPSDTQQENTTALSFQPCWYIESLSLALTDHIQANLREKEGVTYHVSPIYYCNQALTDHSFIGLALDISADKADWVYKKIQELITTFQTEPSFPMIDQSLGLSYLEFNRKYSEDIFSFLNLVSQVQRNPDFTNFYDRKFAYYQTIQGKDIHTLSKTLLKPDQAWKFLVKPSNGNIKSAKKFNHTQLQNIPNLFDTLSDE